VAGRSAVFPVPPSEAAAYVRVIRNDTSQTLTVISGGGSPTIASGMAKSIGFDSTGAFAIN
jgi:hypothetical protein